MRPLALLLAAAVAVLATPASAAPSITLNGVSIDGVTGQRFESCTVVIDEKGDVHITAKGYAVKGAEAAPRPVVADTRAPAGKPTRRYFLVTEHAQPGTQYDLEIFVNSQWIRLVKAAEPQVVMEITRYLQAGRNRVTLAAKKRIQGDRLSYAKDVTLHVVLGEGNVGGGHVMIDAPLVDATFTAAEIDDRTEEHVLDAK